MPPQGQPEHSSRSSRRRLLTTVVAIFLIEGLVIVGVMKLLAGPAEVHAEKSRQAPVDPEAERIVELKVLEEAMANSRTGATYLYETEIYVQVRKKHVARVRAYLDQFRNEIKAEIAGIWRASDPRHLQEPKLDYLTQELQLLLSDRFGPDPATSQSIIIKCVIVMQTGFRIDG